MDLTGQQQQTLLQQIYNQLRNEPLPDLQNVNPTQLGDPGMAGVYSDPAQRQQELEVMSNLRNVFSNNGLDLQDRAAMNEALNRASVTGNSARRALASDFASRGQLGSGAQLAMANQTAQNQANTSNQNSLDIAAQGEQRKASALNAYGSDASALRGQDFSEASARAKAQDEANQWNANAAEKANYYNNGGRQQQDFQNRMGRDTGAMNAGNNLSGFLGAQQQMGLNAVGNLGSAVATGAKGVAGSGGSGASGSTGGTANPDDPYSTYNSGTNYGSSDPSEWANPYGGWGT